MTDYYTRNREALLLKSKAYYQKRKDADPEFYLKAKVTKARTEYIEEEPDLVQMQKNMEWIRYVREQDEKRKKKNNLCYR